VVPDATPPTPWYRQFWPWALIALPATAVVASLITIGIATQSSDSLVVDDYYKVGLAINQSRARDAAAARYGLSARLSVTDQSVELTLAGQPPTVPERLTLNLVHTTRADDDQTLRLARVTGNEYTALLEPLPPGRWNVSIEADNWRLTGTLAHDDRLVELTAPSSATPSARE